MAQIRALHAAARIAMRMSYVKPAEAQRVAEAAVAAGVIESNDDNAALRGRESLRNCCSITGATTVSVPTSYPL